MLFRNLRSVKTNEIIDIQTKENVISQVARKLSKDIDKIVLDFENAIVFPGLINSHDHLDFNLFPRLGNKIYKNYVDWGHDIHSQNKTQINEVLEVPKNLRIQWGIYKNLINGVTTVVNHGEKIDVDDSLISIFQDSHILHSARLEKNWKYKLIKPFVKHFPYTMHMGEGTDSDASAEIDEVIKWNFWQRELIGVHGIAMNEKQAQNLKALIWCADSNFFLNGSTASIDKLKHKTKILFGTDSTVSADWNIWNQLKIARETKMASDAEIFNMLNTTAAEIWKLRNTAEIKENYKADLVIARAKNSTKALESFFEVQPEDILMVISKGKIKLFDSVLHKNILESKADIKDFCPVKINGATKYIKGNIRTLIEEIKVYYTNVKLPVSF